MPFGVGHEYRVMFEDMVEYALKLRESCESLNVTLSGENIGIE